MRRLRVLTWPTNGDYLRSLAALPHDIVVPMAAGAAPVPGNVRAVPRVEVARLTLDVIVYQSHCDYLIDQYEILSPEQRRLPRIYVEHEPPRQHPTDTLHPVQDEAVLVVHQSAFNQLMWHGAGVPSIVIEPGVSVPEDVTYDGSLERGIAVVDDAKAHPRRLGADVFEKARAKLPLDLAGRGSEALGGLGWVPPEAQPATLARYRFFFQPSRYDGPSLPLCRAMMVGLPVVGLATTELVTVVKDGVSGFLDTRPDGLVDPIRTLLADPALARHLGEGARRTALERFGLGRFVDDWQRALALVTGRRPSPLPEESSSWV